MKQITVGRSSSCDFALDDATVSRRHASLTIGQDGRLRLRDLGSANGTFTLASGNWQQVSEAIVTTSDRVRFGRKEIGISELLQRLDAVTVIGLGSLHGGARPGGPLEIRAVGSTPFEEPRRNPETGEIEETGG